MTKSSTLPTLAIGLPKAQKIVNLQLTEIAIQKIMPPNPFSGISRRTSLPERTPRKLDKYFSN
jgi:hypothetical protein